jgi:hypothetical protein
VIQVVADAIRNGWILDNMPNPGFTDVDLTLEQYVFYKKYGVLPESTRQSDRPRGRSMSRLDATCNENCLVAFEVFRV